MSSTYKKAYGLDFPPGASDAQIELICAKHYREELYQTGNLLEPGEHLIRACRMLFTQEEFCVHTWAEEHAQCFCVDDFAIIWGAAACSKSNDFGLFILLDWLTDPNDTLAIVASTSKDMLQLRSFESLQRYHGILKSRDRRIPGIALRNPLGIVNQIPGTDRAGTTLKAAIKGVAVQAGSEAEARANLQGGHLPYVRLLLDELSAMKRAAVEAKNNLAMGCVNFKLFGLCNPDSVYDLAGQYSTPIGGWGSVDMETHSWETQWGKVYHYDGFKSPAVIEEDGAKKYPFLINQAAIDRIVKEHNGNQDAPAVYTYIRGWPPPQGAELTVLTESAITKFRMNDKPIWEGVPRVVAGLDPSFTGGGDGCILQIAEVGILTSGEMAVGFGDTLRLEIEASSPNPPLYQICDQVKRYAEVYGFTQGDLAVDESGTQSTCDVLDREWGIGAMRVMGSGNPSELPVSAMNPAISRTYFKNRTTELWFTLKNFGELGQIRGLPFETGKQFCLRRILTKKPCQLEPKLDFKLRFKQSPDEGDAAALVMAIVRERVGFQPGSTKLEPAGIASAGFGEETARNFDIDGNESNYLVDSF